MEGEAPKQQSVTKGSKWRDFALQVLRDMLMMDLRPKDGEFQGIKLTDFKQELNRRFYHTAWEGLSHRKSQTYHK